MDRYALATGAGKDATLALHRAREAGLVVPVAFNLYDGETERVAFHGTPVALVRAHCEALGLEPVLAPTEPGAFEAAFDGMMRRLREMGVGGVVFGNIHLADVRAWYEERTTGAGLAHHEPLWDEAPAELVREVVVLGYRAVVVSVDLARGDPAWVGRPLDSALVAEAEARGVDPCGEHGEFHTFVYDGPGFRWPVPVETGEVVEMHGHRLVDLRPGPDRRRIDPRTLQERTMLDAIREFFQTSMSHPDDPDPRVRERDLRLAACALLLELAYADDDFSEDEREHLREAVRRQWALDHHQADELIRMAERQRAAAVDLWQFTNLIREHYSLGQKMVLVETMWGLVYSDGELASREDYLMRKISKLLKLKPGYLSEARKRLEDAEDAPQDAPPID